MFYFVFAERSAAAVMTAGLVWGTEANGGVTSAFSCCRDYDMVSAIWQTGKQTILLCGIEAHICILQTALELIENVFEVLIAADAVS